MLRRQTWVWFGRWWIVVFQQPFARADFIVAVFTMIGGVWVLAFPDFAPSLAKGVLYVGLGVFVVLVLVQLVRAPFVLADRATLGGTPTALEEARRRLEARDREIEVWKAMQGIHGHPDPHLTREKLVYVKGVLDDKAKGIQGIELFVSDDIPDKIRSTAIRDIRACAAREGSKFAWSTIEKVSKELEPVLSQHARLGFAVDAVMLEQGNSPPEGLALVAEMLRMTRERIERISENLTEEDLELNYRFSEKVLPPVRSPDVFVC
jgi:hypothetical protein